MKVCWFSTGISSFVACYLAKDVAVLLKGFIPAIGRYEVIRDGIGAFVVPGQIETPVEFRLPVTAWTPLPDARRDRK